MDVFFEGYPAFERFDAIVRAEEPRRANAMRQGRVYRYAETEIFRPSEEKCASFIELKADHER